MKWVLTVDDDGMLTFPEDVLLANGWKEGDVLVWTDNKDGSWTISKKVDSTPNNNV